MQNGDEPRLDVGDGEIQEQPDRLFLEGEFRSTIENSVVVVQKTPKTDPQAYRTREVKFLPRTMYGISNQCTRVELADEDRWWDIKGETSSHDDFTTLRQVRVWCNAEELVLAEQLLVDDENAATIEAGAEVIELDDFLPDLSTQDQILLRGAERLPGETKPGTSFQSEFSRVIGVAHGFDGQLFGDRLVTTIRLQRSLAREYWRQGFSVVANVVEATHGETVEEVLGSGDAQQTHQRFRLQRRPLTRLPSATVSGEKAELEVRVNNVLWEPSRNFVETSGSAETYVVQTTRSGSSQVGFGDGRDTARLTTGTDNVRARYRAGLGQQGNVGANRHRPTAGTPAGSPVGQ